MSVCWLSSASRKTFRTILSLHGDAVLTSVSMETITWKTLYLLPWATGGHLHGDTRGFNIECVSLMCHMDSLVEETLCVLFWKKYGTLLFNILKNFIWFDINVMTHRTPPLCLSQTNTLLSSVLTEAQLSVFTGSDLIFWVCFWKRSQRLHVGRQVTETILSGWNQLRLNEQISAGRLILHQFGLITFFTDFLNVQQKRLKTTKPEWWSNLSGSFTVLYGSLWVPILDHLQIFLYW